MNDKKDMSKDEKNAVIDIAVEEVVTSAEEDEDDSLVITLKKPYKFEGKDYTEIDLSGLENLTAQDMIAVNKYISRTSGGQQELVPELSLEYCLIFSSKAAGQPIEFFTNLPPKIALKVKNRVTGFLFGSD